MVRLMRGVLCAECLRRAADSTGGHSIDRFVRADAERCGGRECLGPFTVVTEPARSIVSATGWALRVGTMCTACEWVDWRETVQGYAPEPGSDSCAASGISRARNRSRSARRTRRRRPGRTLGSLPVATQWRTVLTVTRHSSATSSRRRSGSSGGLRGLSCMAADCRTDPRKKSQLSSLATPASRRPASASPRQAKRPSGSPGHLPHGLESLLP
jgi:hypothetical protein